MEINDKEKSEYYIKTDREWSRYAYWAFIFTIIFWVISKIVPSFGQSLFLYPSLFIGAAILLLYVPVKILDFWISSLIISISLKKIPKNKICKTVIITGKSELSKADFWIDPNYDLDILLVVKYLLLKGDEFSIFGNVNREKLEEIMSNSNIRVVYLLGHGRRHGFMINKNDMVDYCIFNDKKYSKDFVYQLHCNHRGGKSLPEYVVSIENQKECVPEHGFMSSGTISRMYIDKILKMKNLGKKRSIVLKYWLYFITNIAIILSLIVWASILYLTINFH